MSRKGKEKNVTEGSLHNGHHAFPTSGELPYGSSSLYIHALLYILCKCACWFSVQFTQSRSDLTNEVKPGPDKTVSGHTPCLCQPCPATSSSPGLGSVHPTALLCSGQCEPAAGILTTWEVPFSCLWQLNLSAQTAISMRRLYMYYIPWGIYFDTKYSIEVLGSGCPQHLHLSPQWSSYQAPKTCQKSLTMSFIYI